MCYPPGTEKRRLRTLLKASKKDALQEKGFPMPFNGCLQCKQKMDLTGTMVRPEVSR